MAVSSEAIPHQPEGDTFNIRAAFRRVVNACIGHAWIIILTVLITFGLVGVYLWLWPPIYTAEVLVVADSDDDQSRETFYGYWNIFRRDALGTEAELMTSHGILEQVVDDLELTYDEVHHTFLNHAAHLWTESWVGKQYRRAKESIFPPPDSPYYPTEEEIDRAKTVRSFKSGVSLDPVPDTPAGRLVVRGPSPRVAEKANALIESYLRERRLRHVREADEAYHSLSSELDKTRLELEQIEIKAERFQKENLLILGFEKDKVEISTWVELAASINDYEAGIADLKHRLVEIERGLQSEDPEVVASRVRQRSDIREQMRQRRFDLLSQLEVTRQRYREDAPEVTDLLKLIAHVEQQIAAEEESPEFSQTIAKNQAYELLRQQRQQVQTELAGMQAALQVKQDRYDTMRERVERMPELTVASQAIERDYESILGRYRLLQERMMMAEVSRTTAMTAPPSMRVADYARAPDRPTWPKNPILFPVALLVGLSAGIGLALLFDEIQGRISRDRLEVRKDLPIYATVAHDRRHSSRLELVQTTTNGRKSSGGNEDEHA